MSSKWRKNGYFFSKKNKKKKSQYRKNPMCEMQTHLASDSNPALPSKIRVTHLIETLILIRLHHTEAYERNLYLLEAFKGV